MKKRRIVALSIVASFTLGICGCSCSNSGSTTTDTNSTKAEAQSDYNPLDYVTLGQYEGVTVEINKSDYEVTEDKIEDKMKDLCGYTTTYEADPDKKVVKQDSIVNVDYVGKKDGVPFEGGTAKGVWIDVKKNADAEQGTQYISGFTNGLSGARVGTKSEYEVTFPQNYGKADLAGQTVTFEFTINSVAKDTDGQLTDAYVKENSSYGSLDALRTEATKQLETELKEERDTDIKAKVSEAVVKNCTVKSLPEDAVNKRVDTYMKYYENRYATGNSSLEQVIQSQYKMSLDEFKQQVKKEIEEDFKTQIVFEAVAADQKMTVDEDEFKKYCEELANKNGFESVEKLYKSQSDGSDASLGEKFLRTTYICNKALDYCVSKAVVQEK